MSRTIAAILAATLVLATASARADLASDLNAFFDDAAFSTVTPPGIYEGQTGGMLTAGSFTYRVPNRTLTLFSLQMPRLRAGCGGIALFTGGFSYVNSTELVAMLKNIGATAKAFAYQLALRIISAQIATTLGETFSTAFKYLNRTINSCQVAQKIVGGAFETLTGLKHECVLQKLEAGSSWGEAQQGCGAGGSTAGPARPDREPSLPPTGNLVWKALLDSSAFGSDLQLAQVAMSLTGTLVIQPGRSADDKGAIRPYPPLVITIDGPRLIDVLLHGADSTWSGVIEHYRCADGTGRDQCLRLEKTTSVFPSRNALVPRVRDALLDMADAIATDTPLPPTSEARRLLGATDLPVYRYLTAAVATSGPTAAAIEADSYAELIARDILFRYLDSLVREVHRALSSTKLNRGDAVRDFLSQINEVRAELRRMRHDNGRRFDDRVRLTQNMLLFQRMLAARVPAGAFSPYQLAAATPQP